MKFGIFIALLLYIQGEALGRKLGGNVTQTAVRNGTDVHARSVSDRLIYFGTRYGRFCGAGNAQFGKRPIDRIDRCCYYHDLCFTSNCSSEPGQCECNDDFWACAAAVSRSCGWSWSKMCRFTRNAVAYAASATACTC